MPVHPSDLERIKKMSQETPFGERVAIDWTGFNEAMEQAFPGAENAIAVSWCEFGMRNIEALVDPVMLAVIGTEGVFVSAGKRKVFGSGVKFNAIPWAQVKDYGPDEYTNEGGFGKYVIEFGGPGNVFLGRLAWTWRAKRFQAQKNRELVMATASERDRIYTVVEGLLSA